MIRTLLFKRDGNRCVYCDVTLSHKAFLFWGHPLIMVIMGSGLRYCIIMWVENTIPKVQYQSIFYQEYTVIQIIYSVCGCLKKKIPETAGKSFSLSEHNRQVCSEGIDVTG